MHVKYKHVWHFKTLENNTYQKRKSSCRSNICITHKNINSKEKLLRNATEILINIKSGL